MDLKILKQFIKIDQIILILSLGYLGLLFAGKAFIEVWLLFTLAIVSAGIAHESFKKFQGEKTRLGKPSLKDFIDSAGNKQKRPVLLSGIISSAVFILSSFWINDPSYYLSILSVVILIGFPFLSKYNSMPTFNLGIFFALCPVGGFIAANNRFELIPAILFAAVLFWTTGTEISGAIYEIQNDKHKKNFLLEKIGIKKAKALSFIFFIFSFLILILAGFIAVRGLAYWISLFCFAIVLIKQQVLLRSKDTETAKKEFIQINNFIAPLLLVGTFIDVFFH
ncbi:MAG: UbiA family prenyltransferase [Spirochaetota bacterium]